jgi:hypothetical protein
MSSDYDKFKYNLALNGIDADNVVRGVKLEKFGIVDSTTTDQTSKLITALTTAQSDKLLLLGGNLRVKISSSLGSYSDFPGIIFDYIGYGLGDPGIQITGSGYTALTLSGKISNFQMGMYGSGNTANALYLNNPVLSNYENIRIYNLDGFLLKVDKCYDCKFGTVSLELGGNASNYMYSFNDAGDTCNETTTQRLQCEQAKYKAIYIEAETLGCHWGLIHSERLTPDTTATDAWHFGGGSCTYDSIRLSSSGTASNARAHLICEDNVYNAFRSEGAVDVSLEGINGFGLTLNTPSIGGTCHEQTGQFGLLTLVGGYINQWTGGKTHRTVYNTYIITDS